MAEAASLTRRAILGLAQLALILALLLFLGAGTLDYWQGWAFLAVFLGASAWTTADLMRRDPALVERRMALPTTERRARQRLLQAFNALFFLALVLVPALDRRFGWTDTPSWVAILGDVMIAAGFYGVYRVMRANSFAASTVQVQAGQTVISTGPYALVRHPMYAAAIPLIAGIPLALGSWWGLLPVPLLLGAIAARSVDEERMLVAELSGYDDYRRKVRYRMVPGLF
jgi:protein-S-isoprenylcysteine O-methyltransferase Ste14